MERRVVFLVMAFLIAVACGGSNDGGSAAPAAEASEDAQPSAAEDAESVEGTDPAYDYTPLSSATRGDLIKLPAFPEAATFGGIADVRGKETFEMKVIWEGGPIFVPAVLIGSPGQKITLTSFKDTSGALGEHSFTIDDTGLDKTWPGDKTTTVQVTFPEKGEVVFYCSFHVPTIRRGYYMAGLLQVES